MHQIRRGGDEVEFLTEPPPLVILSADREQVGRSDITMDL